MEQTKNFEKLNFDILEGTMGDSIIPEVGDISKLGAPIKKSDPEKVETDPDVEIPEVDDISDLDKEPEDDEDETDTDDDDTDDSNTGSDTEPDSAEEVKGLAQFFKSKGLLEYEEDEFEESEEWVENKVIETLTKRFEDSLDPDIKYINDLYKQGVSLETLIRAHTDSKSLSELSDDVLLEDDKKAEEIVRSYLTNVLEQDEEEVEETIETFKDANMLNKKAVSMKSKLIKHSERQVELEKRQVEHEKAQQEERERERITLLKRMVDSTPEFIKGVPIPTTEKSKFFEGITKKDRTGLTEYQKKLMDPEMQLKVAQFVLLLNGDLSKIETKIKTEVTKNIKKNTETYVEKSNKNKDLKTDATKALDFIKKYSKKYS